MCGYIVNYLLENYGVNDDVSTMVHVTEDIAAMHAGEFPCAQVTKLLESLEFIFIPFVNPDGYAVRFCGATVQCKIWWGKTLANLAN